MWLYMERAAAYYKIEKYRFASEDYNRALEYEGPKKEVRVLP